MNNERILLTFSFLASLLSIGAFTTADCTAARLLAQSQSGIASDRSETINIIKKSKSFVYGEATMPTKEEAYDVAQEILQRNIEEWALAHSKKKVTKVVATDVHELIDSIILKRANMVRVFLYVKKSNLIPVYKKAGLVIVDTDASQAAELEKPAELVSADSVPAAQPAKVKPDLLITPPKDDGVDSLFVEDIVMECADSTTTIIVPTLPTVVTEKELSDNEVTVCNDVKQLKSFFRIREVLVPLKEKGLITEYGKYATLKDPENAFLIVYDSNGRIQAILRKGKDKQKNMNTGEEDSIRNYPDCGAIWFKVKQ